MFSFFLWFPCVGVPIHSQIWKCCFYPNTFPPRNYLYRFGHVGPTFVVISLCVTHPVVCLAVGFWFPPPCISISLNFCQIRPFALSTYNPLHHSVCIHLGLVSFSVYNSCDLLIQRPAIRQIMHHSNPHHSSPNRSNLRRSRSGPRPLQLTP